MVILYYFVYLVLIFTIRSCEGKVQLPKNVVVKAVFAFGDSIVDQGNNNYIPTLAKCNFLPYGKDFNGGIPTGRFCNGKTPPDLIVEELGIKEVVPAYLDSNLKSEDLKTGVSFASGGCGYDPSTSTLASAIPLSTQLNQFKEYIGKLEGLVGEEEANYILENSLFLVVAGSDDLANTYFTLGVRLKQDIDSYTDLMVAKATEFLQDFNGGMPTGRFCNGKTPPDLIVEELEIKDDVPAYLNPNLKIEDLKTGVSFASGGCGFDPLTATIVSAIPLSTQLNQFKEYLGKLEGLVGEEEADYILKNSLFLVVAGSDDLANTYFTAGVRLKKDINSYTDLMVAKASEFIQELYNLGARKIGIFGIPPIGCLPSQRTLAGGPHRVCSEEYNEAAQLANTKFSTAINSLSKKLAQSKLVFIDIYNPLLDLIVNPQKHGFEVVEKGCCGTGKIEVTILCNKFSGTCEDDTKYLFWDSYHPTEKGYKILVDQILKKYVNNFF